MREKAPSSPPVPAPARFMSEEDEEEGNGVTAEPEFVAAAVRLPAAQIAEEAPFPAHQRDFVSDFGNGVHIPSVTGEHVVQPTVSPLSAASNDEERDLDVPTFMRRMKF